MTKTISITRKEQLLDLTILSIRVLLAIIFISYGTGKLFGGQFGNLTQEELATPIKDLSLFKVAWYLFDHQPFKIFIGISQIIASILLLYKRTMIIGALMLIPIIANILIIDLTIMPLGFKIAFGFRLTAYLSYIGCLLSYYKDALIPVCRKIASLKPLRYNHKIASYSVLLIIIPVLEFAPALLKMVYFMATHPLSFWTAIKSLL